MSPSKNHSFQKTITTTGFPLTSHPFGAGHKITLLFSEQLGKIRIISYGSSKPKHANQNPLLPLQELEIVAKSTLHSELFQLQNSYPLYSSSHLFSNLMKSANILYHTECFNHLLKDFDPNPDVYTAMHHYLQTAHLLKPSSWEFCWLMIGLALRILRLLGFFPNLSQCNFCQTKFQHNSHVFFLDEWGWFSCQECSREKKKIVLSNRTFKIFRHCSLAKPNILLSNKRLEYILPIFKISYYIIKTICNSSLKSKNFFFNILKIHLSNPNGNTKNMG